MSLASVDNPPNAKLIEGNKRCFIAEKNAGKLPVINESIVISFVIDGGGCTLELSLPMVGKMRVK
ncbi:unnamed protein product [marine sediment metagenome]|uniref:Uncharacterized protein n=1 Tax=marine sediment metagenome TaxID=412755 RepID=X0V0K6_9ZZZZ